MINKIYIPLFLFFIVFYSCKEEKHKHKHTTDAMDTHPIQNTDRGMQNDTIIAYKQEGAGSKVMVYFPIVKKDTIPFEVSFAAVGDRPVSAKVYFQNRLTYTEHYPFLRLILKKASEDFEMPTLNVMYLGTLPNTGDLAIQITKQLLEENTNLEASLTNYEVVSELLMQTKITSDFNTLLKPYGLKVNGYTLEKVTLASSDVVFNDMKLKTQAKDIPKNILDAIIWIKIGKI